MFSRKVAPGIEIKLFELQDAEPAFEVVNRNRLYLRQWLPWVDYTKSADDIRHFITRVRTQYADNKGPQTGIWIDGRFAGSLGCHPIDWGNRNCSVGYWIDERHQGKGVIARCCTVLLDYLFQEVGLHRVTIQCGTENTRSCAIPSAWASLGKASRARANGSTTVGWTWWCGVCWSRIGGGGEPGRFRHLQCRLCDR